VEWPGATVDSSAVERRGDLALSELVVRPLGGEDFVAWALLFRGYRAFYRLAPDEAVVRRVWDWILDPAHETNGLVVDERGRLRGLAHYRRFARPSSGTVGLYLDDLFTDPDSRGRGVARELLRALEGIALRDGLSVVRWITAQDNVTARRLYDEVAQATAWTTYDLTPRAPRP
jgi:GNAT superfamily N-acetyltransferase